MTEPQTSQPGVSGPGPPGPRGRGLIGVGLSLAAALVVVLVGAWLLRDGEPLAEHEQAVVARPGISNGVACTVVPDAPGRGEPGMLRIEGGTDVQWCPGASPARLLDAWTLLAALIPTEELAAVHYLVGFEDSGSDMLAYVEAVAPDGSVDRGFIMGVNLAATHHEGDGLAVTLVHEMTHVVVATDPPGDDSLLSRWQAAFWPGDNLGFGEESGDRRCELVASFLGPYAATDPEEDLAESVAAFVLDVEVGPELADKMTFLAAEPRIAALREHVRARALAPTGVNFDPCGPGAGLD